MSTNSVRVPKKPDGSLIYQLGIQANELYCSLFIIEVWVEASVTSFPAVHVFECAYITLISALDAYWFGWLLIFTFTISKDAVKALVTSKPASEFICIT